MTEAGLSDRLSKIKLLLLDVDGVLTDGRIVYDSKGRDSKFFNVHDGLGVSILASFGVKTVLITAKASRAITPRARDMRVVKVLGNVSPKSAVLDKLLKEYKVTVEQTCFVGDDLVDLGIMKKVGLAIAVSNAAPEIKQAAGYVTMEEGGQGAVREVAELILKSQGKWDQAVRAYDV